MKVAFIPLASTLASFVFGLTVLDQFFARRRPHQLVWAIGLFMYCLSTFAEFWVGLWGINDPVYRLWYLFGAIFVAAYLGMGTLYLLLQKRTAHIIMGLLVVASLYAAIRVFGAAIDVSGLKSLSGTAMPGGVRLLTPFFNVFGTLALVGGAVYSAIAFWRRKVKPFRVVSNILIAAGAILPAFGGTILRFGGPIWSFYVLELLGIIIIFIGFLRSREVFGFYRLPFSQGIRRVS